jgi:hypothetical protein
MGVGLLISVAGPFSLDKSLGITLADLRRTIATEGIDDDNLIAPNETL